MLEKFAWNHSAVLGADSRTVRCHLRLLLAFPFTFLTTSRLACPCAVVPHLLFAPELLPPCSTVQQTRANAFWSLLCFRPSVASLRFEDPGLNRLGLQAPLWFHPWLWSSAVLCSSHKRLLPHLSRAFAGSVQAVPSAPVAALPLPGASRGTFSKASPIFFTLG